MIVKKVPVYEKQVISVDGNVKEEFKVIAVVKANTNLGEDIYSPIEGLMKGITQLEDGRFVIMEIAPPEEKIFYPRGYVVSAKEAVQEIINHNKLELLEKFPDLKEYCEKNFIKEKEI